MPRKKYGTNRRAATSEETRETATSEETRETATSQFFSQLPICVRLFRSRPALPPFLAVCRTGMDGTPARKPFAEETKADWT